MLSQFHLQSSGLLWVVTVWHVHSLRPVSPLVSYLDPPGWTLLLQVSLKFPKALKEFKGEDDCDERQLEKDGREVRRMKLKSMAAPPRIIDTTDLALTFLCSQLLHPCFSWGVAGKIGTYLTGARARSIKKTRLLLASFRNLVWPKRIHHANPVTRARCILYLYSIYDLVYPSLP